MIKKIKYYFCIFIYMLIMVGCGESSSGSKKVLPDTSINWKESGFSVAPRTEGQELWVKEYVMWQHDTFQTENSKVFETFELGSFEDKIYRLQVIIASPDVKAIKWVLEVYDTSTMKSTTTEITPEQAGIADMDNGLLVGMDIIGPQEFAYQMIGYASDVDGRITQDVSCMIYSDFNQNIQRTDLLPAYKEKGIVEESYDTIILQGECICDSAGNSYVRTVNKDSFRPVIYVFDKSGVLLMEHTMPEECIIGEPFNMENELIFPVYQQDRSTHMIWLDLDTGKASTLAVLENERILQVYGTLGNCIYYRAQEGIVKWDIVSGSRKQIFHFEQNGISEIYDTLLVLKDEKTPVLRMYGVINGEFKDWLVVLSEEEIESKESVRVVNLAKSFNRIESSVVIAGRENPNYHYEYEEPAASEKEEYRTRIFAELAAGKGPDILYVSLEDMEILQKQGMLLELNTLLSGETLDNILPGVIELGTIGNEFVGLPAEVSAVSLIISKKTGVAETWTLDQMISLLESGKLNGRLVQGNMLFDPRAMLRLILEYSLDECFLIDWEKRESHFEDERFLKLLEGSKLTGSEVGEIQGDPLGEKGNQMKIVGLTYQRDIYGFVGTRDTEDGYFVGLPTENGNGNYLETSGVLVVKKEVSDEAAVSAYLKCLLEEEVQNIGDALSVRKLSTEDIVYNEQTQEAWAKTNGGGVLYSLLVFEDGTTSLHEAKALLESCVPIPKTHDAIINIIMEEVQAYYSGEKNAKEVAEIIDNRVQLYLDEGNE